jgi:predicted nucleic acid-binding protein
MHLVDTSVWIDFIRAKPTSAVNQLCVLLETQVIVIISSIIYQKVLQGAELEQRFELFRNYLRALPFCHPKHAGG